MVNYCRIFITLAQEQILLRNFGTYLHTLYHKLHHFCINEKILTTMKRTSLQKEEVTVL
jgi:hypothetical protein